MYARVASCLAWIVSSKSRSGSRGASRETLFPKELVGELQADRFITTMVTPDHREFCAQAEAFSQMLRCDKLIDDHAFLVDVHEIVADLLHNVPEPQR